MEERLKIEHLFNLYLAGKCSPQELQLLSEYIDSDEHKDLIKNLIDKEFQSPDAAAPDEHSPLNSHLDEIFTEISKRLDRGQGS